MTKILIEIDTDTQRVVQIATQEERSYSEDEKYENGNYFNTCYHCGRTFVGHKRRAVCKACAAAPQPEPVDSDLRRDAERWRKMATLMFIGNVELNQDEDGGYSISVDPVENILGKTWCGNSPDEAIDFVPDWSQGEQK